MVSNTQWPPSSNHNAAFHHQTRSEEPSEIVNEIEVEPEVSQSQGGRTLPEQKLKTVPQNATADINSPPSQPYETFSIALDDINNGYLPLNWRLSETDKSGLFSIGNQVFSTMEVSNKTYVVNGPQNRIIDPQGAELTNFYVCVNDNRTAIEYRDNSAHEIAIDIGEDPYSLSGTSPLPTELPGEERPAFDGSSTHFIQNEDKLVFFEHASRQPILKLAGVKSVSIDSAIYDSPAQLPSWPYRLRASVSEDYNIFAKKPHKAQRAYALLDAPKGRDISLRLSPNRLTEGESNKVRLVVKYLGGGTDIITLSKRNDTGDTQLSRLLTTSTKAKENGTQTDYLVNYNGRSAERNLVLADATKIPVSRVIVNDKQWKSTKAQLSQALHMLLGTVMPGMTRIATGGLAVTASSTLFSLYYLKKIGIVSDAINSRFLAPGQSVSVIGTGPGGSEAKDKTLDVWVPVARALAMLSDKFDLKHPQLNTWITNVGLGLGVQIGIAIQGTSNRAIANPNQAIFGQVVPVFAIIGTQLMTDWLRKEGQTVLPEKLEQTLGRVVFFNLVQAVANTLTSEKDKSFRTMGASMIASGFFNALTMLGKTIAVELSRYNGDEAEMTQQILQIYKDHNQQPPPVYRMTEFLHTIEEAVQCLAKALFNRSIMFIERSS